jgi:hypothetical protein
MVADLILSDIESNAGVFPGNNVFIERVEPKRRDEKREPRKQRSGSRVEE